MPFRCRNCGSRRVAYLLLRSHAGAEPRVRSGVSPCCDGCEKPLVAELARGSSVASSRRRTRSVPDLPMRLLAFIGVCWLSGWASAANVLLTKPAQGQTILDDSVVVVASVTEDFVVGKDGYVEIWVDGSRALALTGK